MRFDTEWGWIALWIVVVLCIANCTNLAIKCYNERIITWAENGYTQQTLQGADYPKWVKIQ